MRRSLLVWVIAFGSAGAAWADEDLRRAIGKALFERAWVPAPSLTRANDGLGPVFNARSCAACHPALGRAPIDGDGLVLRLSDAAGRPDPIYGLQIQTAAAPGHEPEAIVENGALSGLAYGPLAQGTRHGLRIAPPVKGLGLLASLSDAAILARADPDDRDGDGVSGRANILSDGRIGRFGWKASTATLAEQIAAAFSIDLGMSTRERPAPEGDCAAPTCRAAPNGGDPEIRPQIVAMIEAFLVASPPSGWRMADPLFTRLGCAACHTPEQGFTDLLLHDMGPALDGGATEAGVLPTEWRTPPLLEVGRGALMHDGRARDVRTAIRLHGGEAEGAKRRFDALSPRDQDRLVRSVEGL